MACKQPCASCQPTRCNTSGAKPAHPRGCLAGVGSSTKGDRQELLRRPLLRCNDRQNMDRKRLEDFCKPNRVQAQLAAPDKEISRAAFKFNWSLPDDPHSRRMGVTAEMACTLCCQGRLAEAVEAVGILVQADSRVSDSLLYVVLKECVAQRDVVLGSRVHAFIVRKGYQSDPFLGNHLLRMYAFHGRLQDAMDVFTSVAKPDAHMWSSIISAHVKHGQDKQAVELYHRMRRSSVKPDGHVFVAALQACARGLDLKTGQQVHADVLATGVEPDPFVSCCLVDMYAKCGNLEDAQIVFDGLGSKNVVTWTAIIAGYSQQGMGQEALSLYRAMQEEGIALPNSVTFVCLLQACASVGAPALGIGKELHIKIKERRHDSDVSVANSLVSMYAKCGSLEDARRVFEGLVQKTVVTWNAMITGYSQQGMGQEALLLHTAMQENRSAVPDSVTFVCLLQACASVGAPALEKGKQLHTQIIEQGYQADVVVASTLVHMYAKCGSLENAQSVFDGLRQKNVVTWTALISGYSQQGMGQEALQHYSLMRQEGIAIPTSVTFVCLLQACAGIGTPALEQGKHLHVQIRERGLEADAFVASSLVNMYAKCGRLEDACSVFDRLGQKDVATWNAMIARYSQQGMEQEALLLYSDMQKEGITAPDAVTFASLLQACASVGAPALEMGQQLHAQIRKQGHQADVFVASSLVNMYAKCGRLEDAQSVFNRLGEKNVVTWSAMISGYSQQGMGQEALRLYSAMQEEGIAVPNSVTFVCLLQACGNVGHPALEKGRHLHAQIREQGLQGDPVVANSLVSMYAKCGSVQDAHAVFHGLGQKDVVTWNAMISGYSQQGLGQEALRLYAAMQEDGMALPDSVTFVCLLQACANVAALNLGRQLHAQIKEQGLEADLCIAGSLINMYGKSGSMADAQQVFDALPGRDVVTWTALIAGYTSQGDSEVVFKLLHKMRKDGVQPLGMTFLSVLTACSHAGLVDKGKQCFEAMSKHHGITPTVEHYSCMVDLLGRAGRLNEALTLVTTMPLVPTAAVWHSLLGACQKWSNVVVACHAFDEAIKLDKEDATAYVLMANVYTSVQQWDQAEDMRRRRKIIGAWKQPGQSWWTDAEGVVHSFLVRVNNKRIES